MRMVKYFTASILIVVGLGLPSNARPQAKNKETTSKSLVGPGKDGKDERVPAAAAAAPDYVIGPEDVVDISVWKEDFSRTVPVRPDAGSHYPS